MKRGALSMFDALGFRRIWQRPEGHRGALDKLKHLERDANEEIANAKRWLLPEIKKSEGLHIEIDITFLSDTVVAGAWVERDPHSRVTEEVADWVALYAVSRVTSKVLARAMEKPLPLAYRGCITFGRFALETKFIVGPAVDAAAGTLDAAAGALVWLAPSAERLVTPPRANAAEPLFVKHAVPLKGGGMYTTWVVNPVALFVGRAARDAHIASLLETFAVDDVDVRVKEQNTERFLRSLQEQTVFPSERLSAPSRRARQGAPNVD
jgi:hypothetical protein